MGLTESLETRDRTRTPGEAVAYPHRLLFLLSEDSPAWFHDLYTRLASSDDGILAVTAASKFMSATQKRRPDALIGTSAQRCLAFFQQVEQTFSEPDRPLRVLVLAEGDDFADADLCVPSTISTLRPFITAPLRLRDQALAFAARAESLGAELEQERRRQIEQQRVSDEITLLKEAIVRNVSHELRTPLLHLKSAVAMMAEDKPHDTLTNYAIEATGRVEAVVKNIAQLASSLEIQLHPVIIREVIDQAVRDLRRSWQHKSNIERLQFDIADGMPLVLGDRQGLVTVLHLLIDNALKFSDAPVSVTAREEADGVCVSVQDAGIGIPADEIAKIFDSFYQVDGSATRRFGGTGVGLAIVRLILDKHSVRVVVWSQPGVGSTFSFVLPVADLQAHGKLTSTQE